MNPMITPVRPLARLASALLLAVAASTAAETLTLTAVDTVLSVNEEVVVTVGLSGASGFSVWGQSLTWDTTKLALVSQNVLTDTTFGILVNDSRTTADINVSGEVRTGGYFEATGPSYPNNGGGTNQIARLTFKRIAAGSTTLTAQRKDTTYPFGAVVIAADGTERALAADATVAFTDPTGGPTGPGDLDGNGRVNAFDFAIFTANFGKTSTSPGWDPRSDSNGDLRCNAFDVSVVTANFGRTY